VERCSWSAGLRPGAFSIPAAKRGVMLSDSTIIVVSGAPPLPSPLLNSVEERVPPGRERRRHEFPQAVTVFLTLLY
jgi:hypothetical protein